MRRLILLVPVLLAACNPGASIEGDAGTNAIDGVSNSESLDPGIRPVRIGEGGPGSSACISRGTVINLADGDTLPLRGAPFASAGEQQKLAEGSSVIVCTRSIDQRWLGVIVPPRPVTAADGTDAPALVNCGVSGRIDSARDYAGPCASGWVSSAFIRLTAN